MIDPQDMEMLADQEHRSWSKWTKWMSQQIIQGIADLPLPIKERNEIRKTIKGLPCMERWKHQMSTLYVDLSEKEKESDRKVVREKLPLYRPNDVSMRGGVSRRG